jgi:hypothetical protein
MCIVTFTTNVYWIFPFSSTKYLERLVQTSSRKMPHIFITFEPGLALKGRFQSKSQNINFHENPSSGIITVPCERTDRQTDTVMAKLKVAFLNFAITPKSAEIWMQSVTITWSLLLCKSWHLVSSNKSCCGRNRWGACTCLNLSEGRKKRGANITLWELSQFSLLARFR